MRVVSAPSPIALSRRFPDRNRRDAISHRFPEQRGDAPIGSGAHCLLCNLPNRRCADPDRNGHWLAGGVAAATSPGPKAGPSAISDSESWAAGGPGAGGRGTGSLVPGAGARAGRDGDWTRLCAVGGPRAGRRLDGWRPSLCGAYQARTAL